MTAVTLNEVNVVVVEPSSTQRRIICHALREQGVGSILEAENGAQAMQCLHRDSPDLVISSLYLPDMNGTDLVHGIRESETHADTPFMLISSETRIRYLDPIRQAGVVGILAKPFTNAELRTALETTLDLLDDSPEVQGELEGEAIRVLVVDDSAFSRKHITRVLQSLGIEQIDHARDGMQGLEMVSEHYYDFIVTDYNMPNMNGREMIDHIRHHSVQASLPVLMVTSEANENRLAAVQQIGVSAICDKPFEPAMVRSLVRKMVSRE